jgi:hypothetical protein
LAETGLESGIYRTPLRQPLQNKCVIRKIEKTSDL